MNNPGANTPRTFAFCPSLPKPEGSPYRHVLSRYLKEHGYEPDGSGSPGLLVLAPLPGVSGSAPTLKPADLCVFEELLGGRVLYVQPALPTDGRSVQASARSMSNFIFGNRQDDTISELRGWLNENVRLESDKDAVDPGKAVQLAVKNLFGAQDSTAAALSKQELWEASLRFTGSAVPAAITDLPWWDILYTLKHVADSYNVVEHDINRYARHSYAREADEICRLQQKRDLLNTAADLWKSLKAASALRGAAATTDHPPRLLLVDDNPAAIRDEIAAMVQTLMPGFELWCWNPTQDESTFTHLCLYNSMTGAKHASESETGLLSAKQEMTSWRWDYDNRRVNESQLKDLNVEGILKGSRFVLVDLLFKVCDKEEEHGPALIRGLRRLCVDRMGTADDHPSLPRFVAFSRSDDLEKIQRALRAGASGYVLKNRLLSLPAELARLRVGHGQDGCQLHRNFHALDALPNETRGLLHEVRIPPIRFDRPQYAKTIESDSRADQMAKLLRVIPKPDLHVHVGSCMTPEFLVVASLVMLAERYVEQPENSKRVIEGKEDAKKPSSVLDAIPPLFSFWSGTLSLEPLFAAQGTKYKFHLKATKKRTDVDPVSVLGARIRDGIKAALEEASGKANGKLIASDKEGKPSLRSVLHRKLNIRDHWSEKRACEELDAKDAVTLMIFAITTGKIVRGEPATAYDMSGLDKKDVLRLFILFIAAQYKNPRMRIDRHDFGSHLRKLAEKPCDQQALREIGEGFKKIHAQAQAWSNYSAKNTIWGNELALDVSLVHPSENMLRACPSFAESPLEFLIASGTRGRNLAEYLAGCEYSGAEHLQRPCLMVLYARQTLEYLVRHGVLYAELRSAVSGYVERDRLTYQQACTLFRDSFVAEQGLLMKAYQSVQKGGEHRNPSDRPQRWAWCTTSDKDRWTRVFEAARSTDPLKRLFPAKVNLIFTGKRHKATREMLMEAAAGVMLNSESKSKPIAASEFTAENMTRCRVVGFDLAGLEESFPPEMFRAQFEQLSRMHIPITAHAGENASARFVESAVLDLRARRLGHGLALADDEKLMARVREERICIELCPVSNYQTNEFAGAKPGREYPLRKFLDFGNIVCLNTDNPIVSYTNIVKEFFQASYAYGGDGLSLWEALRMIRMGFAHAFKGLAERRALIELAEQMIFDLLIDPGVEDLLRKQANEAATERKCK